MGLNYRNLDDITRKYMLSELELDLADGKLYLSPRLSERGRAEYPGLLRKAIECGNDVALAANLMEPGMFNSHEPRIRKGKTSFAKVPVTAPETLAEGEFNRFYLRGLCCRVIDEGKGNLVAYRARESAKPRPESLAIDGKSFDAEQLLRDLRMSGGVDTAFGLPPGPNSGMSAYIA